MPEAIRVAVEPAHLIREAFLAHVLMVAGIVAVAVGYEIVIEHPFGHANAAWILVVLGGPILFLIGRAVVEHAVFDRVSHSRIIGALALAGASLFMILLPPLAVAVTAVAVLAGIAASDAVQARGKPSERPHPPNSRQ